MNIDVNYRFKVLNIKQSDITPGNDGRVVWMPDDLFDEFASYRDNIPLLVIEHSVLSNLSYNDVILLTESMVMNDSYNGPIYFGTYIANPDNLTLYTIQPERLRD